MDKIMDHIAHELVLIEVPAINTISNDDISIKSELVMQSITCQICFGSYPVIEKRRVLKCKHEFCVDCYKGYLENKINTHDIISISYLQITALQYLTMNPSSRYEKYSVQVLIFIFLSRFLWII